MSILDDLRAIPVKRPGHSCTLGAWLVSLSDDERAEAIDVVLRSAISAEQMAAGLRSHGIDVGQQSVAKHRRGECSGCRDRGLAP